MLSWDLKDSIVGARGSVFYLLVRCHSMRTNDEKGKVVEARNLRISNLLSMATVDLSKPNKRVSTVLKLRSANRELSVLSFLQTD